MTMPDAPWWPQAAIPAHREDASLNRFSLIEHRSPAAVVQLPHEELHVAFRTRTCLAARHRE